MNEFDYYLNSILPSADPPAYIAELLVQAERPNTAGIGAEAGYLSSTTVYRVYNALMSTKPKGRTAIQHYVRKDMKRTPMAYSVQQVSDRTKIVYKKKFNHFDGLK